MNLTGLSELLRRLLGVGARAPNPKLPSVNTIHCDTHGEAAETFVCQHIADGLIQHKRVGFFWTVEDPDNRHPDAWCAECEERVKLTNGEWEGGALDLLKPKILCGECYEVAKTFHLGGDPWS